MIFREEDFDASSLRSIQDAAAELRSVSLNARPIDICPFDILLSVEPEDEDEEYECRSGDCGRDDSGRFGSGNDCAADENAGSSSEDKGGDKSRDKKSDESSPNRQIRWTPDTPQLDIFSHSVENNPTKRSEDGRGIESTNIDGAIVSPFAGREFVDPLSVGRHLSAIQAEHRGGKIDTNEPLEGDDFEYMVSGIVTQVEAAVQRGVAPNFYSPEDRKRQLEEYAKVQPLMRGGRTASGACIGIEGPNGECDPSDGISPQAEFLFRAAQALTSPESTPLQNMLSTDAILDSFFNSTDPQKARLGAGLSLPGKSGANNVANLERLQKIIDQIGIEETRKLFDSPPMRAGDFQRFFLDKLPGTEGARYSAKGYLADEVVPLFSIFGPKVGPFFANNNGRIEALTADIWFTRTWGRLSGELVIEASPDNATTHAEKLLSQTGNVGRDELAKLGIDGRQFRSLLATMKKTGVVPDTIAAWAEARYKKYSKDGFPDPKKGTGTEKRYKVDRVAASIVQNTTNTLDAPANGTMRSNMIRVMREASKRTGIPVAYMQDILWQDEQDTWGTLGSRTTTVPGEPSLYSDVIRKIVDNPDYERGSRNGKIAGAKAKAGKSKAKTSKRSLDLADDSDDDVMYSDQKGGIEQALYEESALGMSDDEFVDLAISVLRKNAESHREDRFLDSLGIVEQRSSGCDRQDGGMFAPGNKCAADDGSGGGGSSATTSESKPAAAKQDDSWKTMGKGAVASWDKEKLQESSPVKGGENLESLTIEGAGEVRDFQRTTPLNLTDIVEIGGGTVRGSHVSVVSYADDSVEVTQIIPVDPNNPDGMVVEASVDIMRDYDTGELAVHYGTMFPMKEVKQSSSGRRFATGDISPNELTPEQRQRISSIMMERFLSSVSHAEDAGAAYAEMLAVGTGKAEDDDGYRLWPQFGFDGDIKPDTLKKIPDEIALKAAGIAIPPAGSTRLPQKTVLAGLRSRVKDLTVQQLISTPEGDRWWNENGHTIDLRLNLQDKSTPGYKRFDRMRTKLLARLKRRNEGRSLEFRDDCGRDDGGRFGSGNDCASDGNSSDTSPSQKERASDRDKRITREEKALPKSISSDSAKELGLTKYRPFAPIGDTKNSDFLPVKTDEELKSALLGSVGPAGEKKKQSELVGASRDLPEGQSVKLRIDINAFEDFNTYAVTVHEDKGGKGVGRPLGYDSVVRLSGPVRFEADETTATKIAMGIGKTPLATVIGNFSRSRDIPADIDSWTAVGYDPKKAAFFYDKRTGEEVIGGTDAISVGNSVFVRKPIKKQGGRNAKTDYRSNSCFWGVESRDDCGRDESGRFGSGNDCASDEGGSAAAVAEDDGGVDIFDTKDPSIQLSNEDLQSKSPIKGGEKLSRLTLDNPQRLKALMKEVSDIKSLDTLVDMAGGTRAGASIDVYADGDTISVMQDFPISPDGDMGLGRVSTEVSFSNMENADGEMEPSVHYGGLFLRRGGYGDGEFPPGYDKQIASIVMEKMTTSMAAAEEAGFKYAETTAAGSPYASLKGYRLWPQFGFDGEVSPMLYDDIQKMAAKAVEDSIGKGRDASVEWAHKLLEKINAAGPRRDEFGFLRDDIPTLKVQDLIASREGERFWAENGHDVELSFDFTKKDSAGYKRYEKMKSLLSRLKKRNEGRSIEHRADDCGRDESGRFGSGNDCAADGQSGSTAATKEMPRGSGSVWDTKENVSWDKEQGGDPPFDGAERFSSVSMGDGQKISNSLDEFGVRPEDAISSIGVPDGSHLSIRPAYELSRGHAFGDSRVPPVLFGFESDVAGVPAGIAGTSALGMRREPSGRESLVLYHSTLEVSRDVLATPEKRHAAARQFYTIMADSVVGARKIGVERITLNAAGSKRASERGSSYGKGYTIWPRMGFDAPLPPDIIRQLPESLSHSRSLLDLHATREGTRWWEQNGYDIDVSLDLRDPSSPQNQVFDRFVRRFSTNRREMPLGSGSDWLSPEDLLRMDELWNEIWDDGLLDDYEWKEDVEEKRSADCGRTSDGRFGSGNDCASEDGASSPDSTNLPARASRPSEGITIDAIRDAVTKDGVASSDISESMALLDTPRRFELVGSARKNMPSGDADKAASFAADHLSGLGGRGKRLPSQFVIDIEDRIRDSISRSQDSDAAADNAACLVASVSAAVAEYPDIVHAPLLAKDEREVFMHFVRDGQNPMEAMQASQSAAAYYSVLEDNITVNTDAAAGFISSIANDEIQTGDKFYSSSRIGHALVHEEGHRIHFQAVRSAVGVPAGKKLKANSDEHKAIMDELTRMTKDAIAFLKSPEGRGVEAKIGKMSGYGASHPGEFIAEYFAGLALGVVKRDKKLDKVATLLGFPADRLPEGKKARKKK